MNKSIINNDIYINENLKYIKKDKNVFMYDSKTGEKLTVNENIIKILSFIEMNGINGDIKQNKNIINILNKLEDKGFISKNKNFDYKSRDIITDKVKEGVHLRNLRLNVTEKCNLNCSYCYEKISNIYTKRRVMSWEVAKKSIDEFAKIIMRNNHKNCTIRFFGGEPLLNWNIVTKSMEYARNIFPNDIYIEFIVNTNGTLITDEIAQELAKNNVTVVISMDGIKPYHDSARKFFNDKGSFDIVEKNLVNVALNKCRTNIAVVCSDFNYPHLNEFIEYIDNMQKKLNHKFNICFSNVHICDQKGIISLSIEKRIEYLMNAIRYAKSKQINCYGGLSHQVFDNMVRPNGGRHCVCLGAEFSIDPQGNVFPCDGLSIKLGDIYNIDEIFKSNEYLNLVNRVVGNVKECKGCEIEAYCVGGCYADYLSDGGKSASSCRDCELEKGIFEELVKEYIL